MKQLFNFSFVLLILALLHSCDGNEVSESTAKIRFINASFIKNPINVFMDYKKMYATDIQYLNFSLFSKHIATDHFIEVKDASGNLIYDTLLNMKQGQVFSGIIYDSMNTTLCKFIEELDQAPKGSFCKVRFMHLSNNAPASDITQGLDTSVLFRNFSNGQISNYSIHDLQANYLNASTTGSSTPYYSYGKNINFKAGYLYTVYLKGNMGSVSDDSIGMFVLENNGDY